MSFKGQSVLVRVDDQGQPVLDTDGRAEMKYRESDSRTYRPSPQNLGSMSGADARSGSAGTGDTQASSARSVGASARPPRPARQSPGRASTADNGQAVHVWTDGACSGNPGPMGIGIVVTAGEERKEHGEYLGRGTNNIAELTAIGRGLDIADEVAPGRDRPIRVYTDSSYAIGLLSQGWKAKANQDLVAELRRRLGRYSDLRMIKVEGHAGVAENERCDLLARQAVARNRL
jgi:ribonuclease HI